MQTATRQIPITIKGYILTYDTTQQGKIEDNPDYRINDIRDIAIYIIPDRINILGQETNIDAGKFLQREAEEKGWMLMGVSGEEWECIIETTGIPTGSDITIKDTWMDKTDIWEMNAFIIECEGREYKARNYPAKWDINRP